MSYPSINNCFPVCVCLYGLNFVTTSEKTKGSKTLFASLYGIRPSIMPKQMNAKLEKDNRRSITLQEFKDFIDFHRATLSSLPSSYVFIVVDPADRINQNKEGEAFPCAYVNNDKTLTLGEFKLRADHERKCDLCIVAIDYSKGD